MGKSFKVDLVKRYEVEFVKDHALYKKGDKATMNMCLASKLYKAGKISIPNKLREDAKELGSEAMFKTSKDSKIEAV